MQAEINSGEIEQIRNIAELLSEMIRQFIKTKEELMRTTLQVQIELLTNRLKRLKISITELKSEIDASCVPEEAKIVESEIGDKIRPYTGAEIEANDAVEEFSWKSKHTLENEKQDLLNRMGGMLSDTIEKIYDIYTTRASFLYRVEEKSRLR